MPRDDEQAQAFINLAWKVGGKLLQERLPVPVGPTRPEHMLGAFRRLAERIIDRAVERAVDEGLGVSCQAGCGACCRQLVPISPTEARHLSGLIAQLDDDHRERVQQRFADGLSRFEAQGMLDVLLHPRPLQAKEAEALALRYFSAGVACPFLEEESCSIHSERPIACREYLVSSDPRHCAAPTPETVKRIPIAAEVSEALGRVDRGGTRGDRTNWVPLVVAPRWAELHRDDRSPEPATTIFDRVLEQLQPK
ncbi:MAG: YkgJ family cysteine cluster protein [Deltaproteobacteria bacterium]|jgi:Fe-S-cluster containining protein|nr:YkgJ family cysteine cluster protein [Deltaproteobacteria bacterium]MBW2534177.1 YkgJ family cysteine cluster protein [Deltaproteobacteria bacterium]